MARASCCGCDVRLPPDQAVAGACPACLEPRPTDQLALALGAAGLLAGLAGCAAFLGLGDLALPWPPFAVLSAAAGGAALWLAHRRPPAGWARGLGYLALSAAYPPLVVLSVVLVGLFVGFYLYGDHLRWRRRSLRGLFGDDD